MKEESEDLVSLMDSILNETILVRVFEFLQQKEQLDFKRKTWKLKHQEDKVSKAKQKRSEW